MIDLTISVLAGSSVRDPALLAMSCARQGPLRETLLIRKTNPCKTLLAYKSTNAYHTTGSPTPNPPGGYDGDDDDGFPPPTSPTDPGSDPCPPVVQQTQIINNKVRDSCLSNIVNESINNQLYTSTSNIANLTFGGAQTDYNVTFEDNLLADTLDGQTRSFGTAYSFTATITLNSKILPTASKEYVAVTIMHEVLHAMMNFYNKTNELQQHETMAESYVYNMKMDLAVMFPSMDINDAEALAWGGLYETQAWRNMLKNNLYKAERIININHAYRDKNGGKGNRCK